MKIGDAIIAPGGYEGFVVEFDRYGEKSSVCVFINWDGDGIYVDYKPEKLSVISIGKLTPSMKRDCLKVRREHYLKQSPEDNNVST